MSRKVLCLFLSLVLLSTLLSMISLTSFAATGEVKLHVGHAVTDHDKKPGDGPDSPVDKDEVLIEEENKNSWTIVIRPNSSSVANKLVKTMKDACNNPNIGYCGDKSNGTYRNRSGVFNAAQEPRINWDLTKIDFPCDTDCSALVKTCVWSAGIHAEFDYTGSMPDKLQKTGQFTIFDLSKFSGKRSEFTFRKGDILYKSDHTAIVLEDYIPSSSPSTLTISPTNATYPIIRYDNCNIGGTISSNYNLILVTGDLDGKNYVKLTEEMLGTNAKTCNIGDSSGLNSFDASNLSVGYHYVLISATDASGITKTFEIKIQVKAPSSTLSVSPAKTYYTITSGNACSVGGKITSNYKLSKVTAVLDGNTTLLYATSFSSPKQYNLSLRILAKNLPAGRHTVKLNAWDRSGKYVYKTITIYVNKANNTSPIDCP